MKPMTFSFSNEPLTPETLLNDLGSIIDFFSRVQSILQEQFEKNNALEAHVKKLKEEIDSKDQLIREQACQIEELQKKYDQQTELLSIKEQILEDYLERCNSFADHILALSDPDQPTNVSIGTAKGTKRKKKGRVIAPIERNGLKELFVKNGITSYNKRYKCSCCLHIGETGGFRINKTKVYLCEKCCLDLSR